MGKIRHKFVRNPEENFATKALIFGIFKNKITIVERLLTGKLPTGIFLSIRNRCFGGWVFAICMGVLVGVWMGHECLVWCLDWCFDGCFGGWVVERVQG
jgi:hypothetical protein